MMQPPVTGLAVSKASLKYENGEWLTLEEQEELIRRYEEYERKSRAKRDWVMEFD